MRRIHPATHTPETLLEMATPIPDTGCWLWLGSVAGGTGYPLTKQGGKSIAAHRLMLQLTTGLTLEGLDACHKCDVRTCINPDHLFPGTRQENLADMHRKGRANTPTGERHSKAKLTAEKVLEIRRRLAEGEQQNVLALEFGVRPQTVASILYRRHWKHLPEAT